MSGQNETLAIPVLTINLEGQPTAPIVLPARLRTISSLGAPTARKRIEFGEQMTNGPSGMAFKGLINGKPFELAADGLLAVCIQHELDHLVGKVFVDYLSSLKRNRIRAKLAKQAREHRPDAAPVRASL